METQFYTRPKGYPHNDTCNHTKKDGTPASDNPAKEGLRRRTAVYDDRNYATTGSPGRHKMHRPGSLKKNSPKGKR